MAVYTPVSTDQCKDFLALYDPQQVGSYLAHEGILRGVENSNFFVETSHGQFVLTLYERRVQAADLPFFLGFINHLNAHGLTTPKALRLANNSWSGEVRGKPAALVTRLAGTSLDEAQITPALAAQAGNTIAQMHSAAEDFTGTRTNTLGHKSWNKLLQEAQKQNCPPENKQESEALLVRAEQVLAFCNETLHGADSLPQRVVHADLFCDNFLVSKNTICGVIDFYFACTESLAYDLAVAAIAWSSSPQGTLQVAPLEALLTGYRQARQQTETLPPINKDEQQAWRGLCAGAGLRFFLTRFVDALITEANSQVAVKDPEPMLRLAETFAFGTVPKTALL